MHILGFQAGSKSNWTLTHHHEVKLASEYLKLTENIFDMKKQKGTVQLPNPSVPLARHYIFGFPLNERGLAGFGEHRAGFKFATY